MAIFDFLKRKPTEKREFFPLDAWSRAALVFPAEHNPTVASCVDKISKTLASIPLNLYRNTQNGVMLASEHNLYMALGDPSREETPSLFYRTWLRMLCYKGNAYLKILRGSNEKIVGFMIINSDKVEVSRGDDGRKRFYIDGKYWTERDILHVPYPGSGYNGTIGKSPVEVHKELIALDNSLLEYISNYFNNSIGSRLLISLGSSYPSRKANMDQLYAEIVPVMNKFILGSANAGKPMLGLPDSTLSTVDQTSNVQAELKSLLDMIEHQIALSCFGVPYEILDSAASKYDSLESKQNDFLASCIKPLGDHICQSFEKLLTPAERIKFSIKYEYKNLLTTNTKDTVDYLTKEFTNGALTMNEVRKKLGMEDMGEAGDVHFIPSNLMPLTKENIDAYMAKNKLALQQAEGNHNPNGDDKS